MRLRSLLLGGSLFVVAAAQVHAQEARARAFAFDDDEWRDRPMIGVGTAGSGGKRDTLGLLVTSVTPGGPAEKAGIEEGARIAAVNGVNLRLSAADAGEPDMAGVASRRLTREIRKVKAGDEVELRVVQNGAQRTVKVKTVAADDLRPERASRVDDDDRAVLGISLNPTGTRRDTLGVFVSSVYPDGPAEKAGLVEGDRIAAVNGVDLRVPREDAGDEVMASAKHSRFSREMRNVKAGQDVELRVYSNGAVRTVRVRAARNEDVYRNRNRNRSWVGFGDGETFVVPRPPRAPIAIPAPRVRVFRDNYQARGPEWDPGEFADRMAMIGAEVGARMSTIGPEIGARMSELGPEISERVREAIERARAEWPDREYRSWQDDEDEDGAAVRTDAARPPAAAPKARTRDADALEAENRELSQRLRELEARQIPRARSASASAGDQLTFSATPTAAYTAPRGTFTASGEGERFSIMLPGLRLSPVSADLASYFGAGSERGLLVVEADARWPGLRAGDVLMTVDGKAVSDGRRASISMDLGRPHDVEILRGGKRQSVTLAR